MGNIYGSGISVILGLILDYISGRFLGLYAITFAIIALFGSILNKNFSKEHRITIMVMVMAMTFFSEFMIYIFQCIKFSADIELLSFLKIILVEMIYNVILTIILYPIIIKAGSKIEKIMFDKKSYIKYL